MVRPKRGEVWIVDLGLVAKIRPCLVISIPILETDRALVTLIPHTTSARGTRFEVSMPSKFLNAGVFDAQNIITIPTVKLLRRLGKLSDSQMILIEQALCCWLGLSCGEK